MENRRLVFWSRMALGSALTLGAVGNCWADNVQKCVKADHAKTLNDALKEEADVDQKAALLKSGYARSMAQFVGWKVIPSDIRIVAGPTDVRTLFPTSHRVMPSMKAKALAGQQAESRLRADCIVADAQGGLWAVFHYLEGTKSYIDVEDTDKAVKPRQQRRAGFTPPSDCFNYS